MVQLLLLLILTRLGSPTNDLPSVIASKVLKSQENLLELEFDGIGDDEACGVSVGCVDGLSVGDEDAREVDLEVGLVVAEDEGSVEDCSESDGLFCVVLE